MTILHEHEDKKSNLKKSKKSVFREDVYLCFDELLKVTEKFNFVLKWCEKNPVNNGIDANGVLYLLLSIFKFTSDNERDNNKLGNCVRVPGPSSIPAYHWTLLYFVEILFYSEWNNIFIKRISI